VEARKRDFLKEKNAELELDESKEVKAGAARRSEGRLSNYYFIHM
jgi:hypothetical protein